MSDKAIILIGGGGHCRSCIDVIEKNGIFHIAGIIEHPVKGKMEPVMGYPIIGNDNQLAELKNEYDYALITIGQIGAAHIRQRMFHRMKLLGFKFPAIVSPLAYVSSHAKIGAGTIVMHRALVNAGARIGVNCILNTGSIVEHDVSIGSHTHISTAAVINGGVAVGTGTFVGSNAAVIHGARLPERYFFKAGIRIVSGKDGSPAEGKQ